MHIQQHIQSQLQHLLAHQEHFRALFHTRVLPFAVQVNAYSVGTQMTTHAAIRVHIRYDVEHGFGQQATRYAVIFIQQAI